VFVKEIRPESNEVVLAALEGMYKTNFLIRDVNVADKHLFTDQFDIVCRIRYRKQNTLCRVVFLENSTARVELAEALESIAPGQTAVFYQQGKVLGGGFIVG
jgi:tRNA-specific 2-thiouridylase